MHLVFTVTTDLVFDQRMQRICTSLAQHGYRVTLVGRQKKTSLPLAEMPFEQKRLKCIFEKGFIFYAEYNLRLFFFLLTGKMEGICAIDLDTILPVLLVSKIRNLPRVYDAHEYFTELKEVRSRPLVQKVWTAIEKFAVPKFANGYTVSKGIAEVFYQKYQRHYIVIRNMPILRELVPAPREKFLLYQGAVNEARGFEALIPAMKEIDYTLIICGDGNFMKQLKKLVIENNVQNKVILKGMLLPGQLWEIAQRATLGIGFTEKEGLNQYLALPNKFFDYIQAGLPQLTMNFPEYARINSQYKVAVLIDDLNTDLITQTINRIMGDESLLDELRQSCYKARLVYHWQNEEKALIQFYHSIFRHE